MLRSPLASALPIAVALALALAPRAHAQEAPGPDEASRLEVEAGDVAAAEVIRRWAAFTGRVVTVDPQIEPIRLNFAASARLDRETLRHVLDMHDVVLVERGETLQAHHRRNLNQKVGPPWDLVVGAPPESDRYVTSVVQIEHGAGNAIFATVRGLLTRDTNRIGNILYIQGPEVILICDLAPNIRYYLEVIAALDRPAPVVRSRTRVLVYEARRAWWTRAQGADPAPAALAGALRAASSDTDAGVVLLAEGLFDGGSPVSIERRTNGGRERLALDLGVAPRFQESPQGAAPKVVSPSAQDGLLVRLSLELDGPDALSLVTTARFFPGPGATALQSVSGRGGEQPTDVVLVLQDEPR